MTHSFEAALRAGAVVLTITLALGCSKQVDPAALDRASQQLQAKQHAAAVITLKSYLQDQPSSPRARHLLGVALLATSDAQGAEVELQRAVELGSPATESVPPLARALLQQKKFGPLLHQYGSVDLGKAEANADLGTTLALAHLAGDAPDRAEERLQRVLALVPGYEPAMLAQARVQAGRRDFDAALATVSATLARQPASVEALQLQGDLLLRGRRDLAGAADAYARAIALEPGNAFLHSALITVRFAQQDGEAAAKQFEAMKKALPKHPLTQFHSAVDAFRAGDAAKAHEQLQPALAAYPDRAAILYLAGGVEAMRGALPQAEAHLTKALSVQPDFVPARRLLAEVFLRGSQPGKALNTVRGLAEQPDADAETLTLAGRAALLASDERRADAYFARASKLKPTSARVRTSLATARLARGHTDAALAELQAVASSDQSVSADLALISAHLGRRDFNAALAAVDALDRKQPTLPAAPEMRARVQLAKNDVAGARQSLESALQRKANYMPAVASLAAIDFLEKRPDAAKARFLSVIKSDPRNVQAYLSLADLEERLGAEPAAVAKRIGEAVTANPSDTEARLALIEHYRARGDGKSALEAAQAAVAALPGNPQLLDQLARAHWAVGEANQAASLFGRLSSEHGQLPLGPNGLAEMALGRKDFETALRQSKKALESDPRSATAQRNVITAAVSLGKFDDGIAAARAMQSMWPEESIGYILEGEIEVKRSRWDAAVAAFEKATQQPNAAQAPARLHATLLASRKAQEADRFAQTWLSRHPKDGLFLLYLAEAASKAGDVAVAERRYREVLAQQPANVLALNNLAWLLIKQGKAGSLRLAEQAAAANPKSLAVQDTLAMALATEGQRDVALDIQKKVIASAPNVPGYRLTLARIYLLAGDKAKARAELDAVTKADGDFPGRSEVEKLRKSLGSAS